MWKLLAEFGENVSNDWKSLQILFSPQKTLGISSNFFSRFNRNILQSESFLRNFLNFYLTLIFKKEVLIYSILSKRQNDPDDLTTCESLLTLLESTSSFHSLNIENLEFFPSFETLRRSQLHESKKTTFFSISKTKT